MIIGGDSILKDEGLWVLKVLGGKFLFSWNYSLWSVRANSGTSYIAGTPAYS
jgi:hypothetical protein